MTTAYISEIYTSLQGEGPYAGQKQIFVRLAGCPLRCDYCDTPASLTAKGHPRREVAQVLNEIVRQRKIHGARVVSFTGGEPLVQAPFLQELMPLVKKKKFSVYLETAGVHPKALASVVRHCDVIAMDMKFPSATGRSFWNEHAAFLKIGGKKIFVKTVITKHSKKEELARAVEIAAAQRTPPLFVLQPVTPERGVEAPGKNKIGYFYEIAARKLPRVLVMPQQHKLWGAR